jgi:hypothetical protein
MTEKNKADKTTIYWTNWRGKKETRAINHVIDIREFLGTPGYSMLVVAANTNLSAFEIEMFLGIVAREFPLVERTPSWIKRRRWLFQQPGTNNHKSPASDQDGKHARAVRMMGENPKLSVRGLSRLLKEYGIKRSPEWCRKHRGDAVLTTLSPI